MPVPVIRIERHQHASAVDRLDLPATFRRVLLIELAEAHQIGQVTEKANREHRVFALLVLAYLSSVRCRWQFCQR